jgi:RNA recognition motif-containing protein|tara:strand:+ start:823 stop:1095 length:273 start_codon:yes stop_codon:yes gene_type:complete
MSYQRNYHRNRNTKVKISNLPRDINVKELNDLLSDWGQIGRINIRNICNKENKLTIAFVDFYNLNEAEYFLKALDKTAFDHYILDIEILK